MSNPQAIDWPGRRDGDPVDELVASYLVMDIQDSPEWAADLKLRLEQLAEGELDRWVRLGNVYELVLTSSRITIEATEGPDADRAVEVPHETLAAAVDAWCARLPVARAQRHREGGR